MKLPNELEDKYVREVLYNYSLENLPKEQWKPIECFENYEIYNYGRVKPKSPFSYIIRSRTLGFRKNPKVAFYQTV